MNIGHITALLIWTLVYCLATFAVVLLIKRKYKKNWYKVELKLGGGHIDAATVILVGGGVLATIVMFIFRAVVLLTNIC